MARRNAKSRTDREVAKRIALDLPDVELGSHHGTMDIRVHNKIFATFPAQDKIVDAGLPQRLADRLALGK